jgi:hypothetical protein
MTAILTACRGCGRAQDPRKVLYDAQGEPTCDACARQVDLLETDRRAAGNIRRAGYTAGATGAASLVAPMLGMLAACVVVAWASGLFALVSLDRSNERFARHLTRAQRAAVWVLAIGGMVAAAAAALGGPLIGSPLSRW